MVQIIRNTKRKHSCKGYLLVSSIDTVERKKNGEGSCFVVTVVTEMLWHFNWNSVVMTAVVKWLSVDKPIQSRKLVAASATVLFLQRLSVQRSQVYLWCIEWKLPVIRVMASATFQLCSKPKFNPTWCRVWVPAELPQLANQPTGRCFGNRYTFQILWNSPRW